MEQTISISELKKLLPDHAEVTFQRKKGDTGTSLDIKVIIRPPVSEKEHERIVKSILDHYGEDCHEVFTEETGHWFHVYLRMSSVYPTTVTM